MMAIRPVVPAARTRLALVAVVMAWCPGCSTQVPHDGWRLEFETRQTVAPVDEAGAGDDRVRTLLGAREVFWIGPTRCRVESVSTRPRPEAAGASRSREERVETLRILDFAERIVWSSSTGGATWTARRFEAIDHELETVRRRARLDVYDVLLGHPDLSLDDDREFLAGRGERFRIEALGGALASRRLHIVDVPGIAWTVTLQRLGEAPVPPLVPEALLRVLASATGSTAARVAALAEGRTPTALESRLLAEEEMRLETGCRLRGARPVTLEPDFLSPPRKEPFDLPDDGGPGDLVALVVRALAGTSPLPAGVEVPEDLLLELERVTDLGDDATLARLAPLWEDPSVDFTVRVEALRLALRAGGESGRRRVDTASRSTRGDVALPALEAWIAERPEEAFARVIRLLERRGACPDVPEEILAAWGLRHLRVLADRDPRALRADLRRMSREGADREPPLDPVDAELALWRDWLEGRGRGGAARRRGTDGPTRGTRSRG